MFKNKDYELINLEVEYPGINGGIKWAVISDLPMEVLMERYPDELAVISPIIPLSTEEGEVFREFHKNNKKHEMRSIRTFDANGYVEGMTEEEHFDKLSQYNLDSVDTTLEYKNLKDAIESLPEVQKRRCKLYFYHGFSEEEIARIEGVDQAAVSRTLAKAINNLKKFF